MKPDSTHSSYCVRPGTRCGPTFDSRIFDGALAYRNEGRDKLAGWAHRDFRSAGQGLSRVCAMDIIALAPLRIRPAARQNQLEVDPIIRG
jgi:hypothetical protein